MEREKLQSCDWPMDVWLPDWSQAPPTCTGLTGHQPPLSFNCLCCTFTWISLPSTSMPIGNGEALIHWTHLALSMRPPRWSAGRRGPGCDNGGGRVNYTHTLQTLPGCIDHIHLASWGYSGYTVRCCVGTEKLLGIRNVSPLVSL